MVWKVHWDPAKAEANWRKHGIRFEQAERVLRDPLSVTLDDPIHSDDEDRYFAVGEIAYDRLIIISYTIRDDDAWLISRTPSVPSRTKALYERRPNSRPRR